MTEIWNFLWPILKTIGLWLDWIVYEVLSYTYALFAVMCRLNFSNLQSILSTIAIRIQVLFGVVMLFVVAFNLLTLIIDPSDKKHNGSKLVTKVIVSVVLLVAGNFVFGLFDNLQNAILNEKVIEKVIIGNNSVESYNQPSDESAANNQYKTFIGTGRWISYNLFFSFYDNPDPDPNLTISDNEKHPELKKEILNGEKKFRQVAEHAGDIVRYEYPIVSTFCGLLVIVMYVTFAIEIGVRAFNIMILRVLFPVAAMGYIVPGKGDKILKKYVSTYFETYAQLFAKIFMSYLIVYLMMALMSLLLTQTGNSIIEQGTIDAFENQNFLSSFPVFFRAALLIIIFVALYLFFINLPKMLGKILGVEVASGRGLIAKTFGVLGAVGTLASAPLGLAAGFRAGIRNHAGVVGTTRSTLHGMNTRLGTGLRGLGNNLMGEDNTNIVANAINRVSPSTLRANARNERRNLDNYAQDNMTEFRRRRNQQNNNPTPTPRPNPADNLEENVERIEESNPTPTPNSRTIEDSATQEERTERLARGERIPGNATNLNSIRGQGETQESIGYGDDNWINEISLGGQFDNPQEQHRPQNYNSTPTPTENLEENVERIEESNPTSTPNSRLTEDSTTEEERTERLARGERMPGNDQKLNSDRGQGEEQESNSYDERLSAKQIEENQKRMDEAKRQYEGFNEDIGE